MKNHLISTLQPGKYFTMPAYLDDHYILLSPEVPLTQEIIDRLRRWGFEYVLSDGDLSDKMGATPESAADAAADTPTAVLDSNVKELANRELADKVFRKMVEFTEKIFTDFVSSGAIPVKAVSDEVRAYLDAVRDNKNHILRLTELEYPKKNYLVIHSVKTAIIGMAIGMALKLPNHRLIELGSSLLLHEIGMIRLPPKIYMTEKALSPEERKAITAHTLLGFKVLKANDYPMSVCLAVLESHENLDGTGYPRNLTGDKISLYAKIIAVASSYVAMSSTRPFRGPLDGHNALLELLKNKGKRYDELILRSLIQTVSLYPIGTYVELANGALGMVIAPHNENPRTPTVRLVKSPGGEIYAENPIIDTSREGVTIKRSLSSEEAQVLRGALN